MKRYIIELEGFGEGHEVFAENAGKAKWKDFCAAREAGYFRGRHGFKEYLSRVYVLHMGDGLDPRTPEYGVAA